MIEHCTVEPLRQDLFNDIRFVFCRSISKKIRTIFDSMKFCRIWNVFKPSWIMSVSFFQINNNAALRSNFKILSIPTADGKILFLSSIIFFFCLAGLIRWWIRHFCTYMKMWQRESIYLKRFENTKAFTAIVLFARRWIVNSYRQLCLIS